MAHALAPRLPFSGIAPSFETESGSAGGEKREELKNGSLPMSGRRRKDKRRESWMTLVVKMRVASSKSCRTQGETRQFGGWSQVM